MASQVRRTQGFPEVAAQKVARPTAPSQPPALNPLEPVAPGAAASHLRLWSRAARPGLAIPSCGAPSGSRKESG